MAARARRRASATSSAAIVALTGDAEPELLADLPGERVGKARMLELADESNRQVERAAEQLDRRRRAERRLGQADVRRAGHRSGCGSSSSSACGSTRTIPSLRGGRTSRRLGARARALNDLRVDSAAVHRPRHRPDGRPPARVAVARLRVGRPPQASRTWRTCRRRRCSPRPTAAAPKVWRARRARSRCTARWSRGSRCGSRTAASSRCTPTRART